MGNETLTREEHAFREPEREGGKPGLAYQLKRKRLDFRLAEFRQIAQNLSNDGFRTFKYEEGRPDDYQPTEADRRQYGMNGNLHLEERRALGFISETGTELHRGSYYLDMHTRTQLSDEGQIWFYEKGDYNDREGIYVSIYLSEERMLWLWEQMRIRPNAEVHLSLEAMLWQHEVDSFLAEPEQFQSYYIEKDRHAEVIGCTLRVSDKDTPRWKAADDAAEADEPVPAKLGSPTPSKPPQGVEKLLQRLIRGVGWMIALLVVLILAVLNQNG